MLKEEKLRGIGKDFVNDYLYDIERAGIHSYRYRTKNPGHLLEKIIRKRKEDPEKFKDLNRSNYYKYMTDLIGIRNELRRPQVTVTLLGIGSVMCAAAGHAIAKLFKRFKR